MTVLIKQATIIDPASPFNGQTKDIFIKEGMISSISNSIKEKADQIIEGKDLHASIGWMDIFAHFCDPGYEHRESLETGANAAAAGGFTDVMVLPNTNPALHTRSQIEYVIQKSTTLPVSIIPIGAVTKNAEGKELAEMYDMHESGAIAFSDGTNSIQSPGLLLKALQYVLAFEGTIIQLPDDKTIHAHGIVNEGIISTQLGLPGKPSLSEELMIARDIELVKYSQSRIHFTGVSTQKSMELIKAAKAEGLQVTCSASPYHLYFCDEDLITYDTNLKVNPPLRTRKDMLALRAAVKDGIVDCIASHHTPQDWDHKTSEFEYAKNGMIGLETLFGFLGDYKLPLHTVINLLAITPRKIFGITLPEIKEGVLAKLTLFYPFATGTFESSMIKSKSKNSAFVGKQFTGKVAGIVNGKSTYFN